MAQTNNQTRIDDNSNVELLSSYNGKISEFITLTTKSLPVPFDSHEICNAIGKNESMCCGVSIVTASIQVSDHPTFLKSPEWVDLIKRSKTVSLDTLNDLYKDWGSRPENPTLLPSDTISKYVNNAIRLKTTQGKKNITVSQRMLDWYLIQAVKEFTPEDKNFIRWESQKSKTDAAYFEKVLTIEEKYRALVERAFNEVTGDANCQSRFLNIANLTAGNPDHEKKIGILMSSFARDKYYGIVNDSLQEDIYGIADPRFIDSKAPHFVMHRVLECQCEIPKKERFFDVDIPGGNILVGDSFVLIGKDELEHLFLDRDQAHTRRRLDKMKITSWRELSKKELTKKVTAWLEVKMCGNKRIVWVGNEEAHQRYHINYRLKNLDKGWGYIPMYHIDLFLSLIGPTAKHKDEFNYLLALPTLKFQKIDEIENKTRVLAYEIMVNGLRNNILKAAKKMEEDVLQLTGVTMRRIMVPMPLGLGRNFECLDIPSKDQWLASSFSFVNGLVENDEGQVVYYMPDYEVQKNQDHFKETRYMEAMTEAKRILEEDEGMTVKLVLGDFGSYAGLHCKVQVLKRSKN